MGEASTQPSASRNSSKTGVRSSSRMHSPPPEHGSTLSERQSASTRWDLSIAIAVAVAIPCLAAGYAVGKVGSAALGAASEKPELLTRSLLFVALAEGIAIYGLLVAVLLYLKL